MMRISYNYCVLEKHEFIFEISYHDENKPNFIVYKCDEDDRFFRINTKYKFLDNGDIKIFKRKDTNEYDIGIPLIYNGNSSNNLINCTIDMLYHFAYNSWKMGLKCEPVRED